jgi:hypothetical protein
MVWPCVWLAAFRKNIGQSCRVLLKMYAVCFFETFVAICKTTWCEDPDSPNPPRLSTQTYINEHNLF